ncbi:MAG: class I SAM-dependent methyltransferase [bacterium]|nr:class I SAM-dependent methyltransferase [bacterium]
MLDAKRSGDDAFGQAFLDHMKSGSEVMTKIVRVEDGNVEDHPISIYFQTFDEWNPLDRALMQWVKGRVLDVGVGAGRVALYLQEQGFDVVGIDLSPGAIETCVKRGVKDARLHNILESPLDEKFDAILMLGYNLGIAATHANVAPYLDRMKSMLNPGGRIIFNQVNWQRTEKPEHLKFHEAMRKIGRYPVEMTLKIVYGKLEETFGWCLTSQEELVDIAKTVGLKPEAIIDCGGIYGAVLIETGSGDG